MIFFNIAWKMLTLCFDRQFWRFSGWPGQTVSKYPEFQGRRFQIFWTYIHPCFCTLNFFPHNRNFKGVPDRIFDVPTYQKKLVIFRGVPVKKDSLHLSHMPKVLIFHSPETFPRTCVPKRALNHQINVYKSVVLYCLFYRMVWSEYRLGFLVVKLDIS